MTPVEVVSFDVDGTLYDLRAMKRAVTWAALCRAYHPGTYRELSELGRFRAQVEALRAQGARCQPGKLHHERARLLELEARWYVPAIRKVGMYAPVRELLERARARGLPCVVVSDFVSSHKLRALGIEQAFGHVLAGEELGHLKPATQLFEALARRLGVDPSRILHVGDRPECDGLAARGAGCRAVMVSEGRDAMLEALG